MTDGSSTRPVPPVPGDWRLTLWIVGIGTATAVFLALATASQTYLSMRRHGHSFGRILAWQLGCWAFWAFAAPWVVRIGARWRAPALAVTGLILTAAQSTFATGLALAIQPFVPQVSPNFLQAFTSLWWFPLLVDPLVFALLVVGGRGLLAYEDSQRLAVRESQLEAQLVRAQLDALRLEIQPHFLFNTLNSIAALIRHRRNDSALSALLQLSELMRATLRDPVGQFSPVDQELDLMRRYVELHQLRFGERLTVAYDVDPACAPLSIPTLVLQPIIENAFTHGVAPSEGACHVEVGGRVIAGTGIRLWVTDDGCGLPGSFELQRDSGTGLRNTQQRLQCLYGDSARLTLVRNSGGGTRAELVLPFERRESDSTTPQP